MSRMATLVLAGADISSNGFLLILIVVAFFVLLLVVAMRERRYSRPYVAVAEADLGQLSPYVRRMSDDAQAAGFVFCGYAGHVKPSIQTRGTLWLSPDGRTLVIIISGTVSRLKMKQTSIISPLNNETFLCTTDHIGDGDPSGLLRYRHRMNSLFPGLWKLHQRRTSLASAVGVQFGAGNALEITNQLFDQRAHQLVRKGLARFIEGDEVCWRHTFRGALYICAGFFTKLGEALPQIWRKYLPGAGSAV